ncbi:hypothetical protein ACLOJK_007110, partial [Asimina triloba]
AFGSQPVGYVARGGVSVVPAPAACRRGPTGRRTGGGALHQSRLRGGLHVEEAESRVGYVG